MSQTDDLGQPDIYEEVHQGPRVLTPVTFFRPDAALADSDFRPSVSRSSAADRVIEDGHGWRPPSIRTEMRPEDAHDPHVSPLPEMPARRQTETQESLPFPE